MRGLYSRELVYEGTVRFAQTCATSLASFRSTAAPAESVFRVYAMILRNIAARTVAQTEHDERSGGLLHKIKDPSWLPKGSTCWASTSSDNRAEDGSVLLRVDDPSALGKLNAGANPTCG